jgi:hypothetical protein
MLTDLGVLFVLSRLAPRTCWTYRASRYLRDLLGLPRFALLEDLLDLPRFALREDLLGLPRFALLETSICATASFDE